MKDIREIMMEMDDLTKKQIAADLSDEEKEELMNLINTTAESSYNFVSAGGNFGTTTPPITTTPPPTTTCPPEACNEIPFCCVVTFPSELTPVENDVHAAVVPKDLTVEPNGQCTFTIGRCTVTLDRVLISGCVEVFSSLGVTDICGNLTHVCCNTCVSIGNQEILCCGFNGTDVGFTISGLTAAFVAEACDGAEQIWEISGFITFNCEPCATNGVG